MISAKPFHVMTVFTVLLLLGLGVVISRTLNSISKSPRMLAPVDAASEVAGYRRWTKVNPAPARMAPKVAAACASAVTVSEGPHQDKYITVYVNDIGRKAMLEQLRPKFPEGSIIVKEKLTDPSSEKPELLTVMIKRSPGYNPNAGDWEFMVTDGNGTLVQERGQLRNCQTCHTPRSSSDYIFRNYLPDDVANKLQ